ncbi:hypothetical protein WDH52_09755 [Streptomyces sp. TRM70308]|uniref:hypothetical protein n=1 Tax=Streptomyces sp. TRM70308 TaxID=3131932 RepID=UPI003D064A92
MLGPEYAGFEGEEFNLEATIWVRGVGYVAGWRHAVNAGGELTDALTAAGVDTSGVRMRASSGPDSSGSVRLVLPPAVARGLAALVL